MQHIDFAPDIEAIHYSPGYVSELKQKINDLESQNRELQAYRSEVDRLLMELNLVTTAKEIFEEKCNEASMRLLCFEDDDSVVFSDFEQLKTQTEKAAVLLHANEDLLKEYEECNSLISSLTTERDSLHIRLLRLNNSKPFREDKSTSTDDLSALPVQSARILKSYSKPDDPEDFSSEVDCFTQKPQLADSELLSKTSASPLMFKSSTTAQRTSLGLSLSPVGRSVATPKVKLCTLASPKLKRSVKHKSVYMPSFLRKQSKSFK